MKIRIAKRAEKMIGGVRISEDMHAKLKRLAEESGTSMQEVIRAILDQVIDSVEA